MQFFTQVHILIVITLAFATTTTTTTANAKSPIQTQLKQNNFLEWLISIFQLNPISGTPIKPPVPTKPSTETKQCQPCSCGTANVIKRIVGGEETQEIRYPWMALLRNNNRFYCGGSLIADRYVATAAHCLRGFPISRLSVSLLVHDRKANSSRVINRKVQKAIIHENYNPFNVDNDIGLLLLKESVEMSNVLRPVCMPKRNESYVNYTGVASGWGAVSEGGPLAQKLMQVEVPILTNEECNKKYGEDRITANMLCAGVPEGEKDACQGDSGGPFHVHNKDLDTFDLAGIVSWGEGCARPNKPGVYTRVTQYLDWIEERSNDSCRCEKPNKKLVPDIFWEFENVVKKDNKQNRK